MTELDGRNSDSGSPARLRLDRTGEATYWDIDDIQFHCRIGRSTAWRLVRESAFPAPVVFGKRSVLWPRVEVVDFMEAKRDPSHYRSDASVGVQEMRPAFTSRTVRARGS